MAEPRKIVQGGLKALEAATKAVDAEDAALAAVKAAERAAAGRRAADVAKATAPMKMSEALGNMNVEGKGALKITQADRTRVGGGNIGGPMFSGLQQVDPIYEGAAWGVGKKSTASAMINQSDPNTLWTTVLGSADQLKTNPLVFNKLRKGFVDSMKEGNLSDELAGKINHNLSLVFGEGADIRDPKIWQKANTFDKRAALADAMLGQGIPPSKGGVALGGEKSGKGVIFRPTDILKRETEPMLLHPEHGGDVPSFSVGPRLFTLSGDVKERPDLHPGFPIILQGEDKGVVFTPVPGLEAMPDYVKRHEAVKGRKPSGYFDWTMGLKGEGLPTQPITEEYLTYLQKMGKKKGGAVQESEKDMAEFQKRFALHKATGGKVDIPRLSLKKAKGGAIHMQEGGSFVLGKPKSFTERLSEAVPKAIRIPKEPLAIILNHGYDAYKNYTGKDPLGDFQKELDRKLNPETDTGSAPVQQFEKLEKAKGGGVHMVDGGKIAKGLAGAIEKASAAVDAASTVPKVDRLSMNYKDVTKRVPEVADAVEKLFKGEITKAQYNDIVNQYKPVTPYSFVPKPATKEEAIDALRGDAAKSRYGAQAEYTPGSKVGLRLDIPAYTGKGVWVNSIHDEKAKKVAYGPVASVKNADLGISQNESKRIALGGAKAPYAKIKGEWSPITEEEAVAKAQEYLNHPEWRQIGMDPERHSYFYDRATMQPITGAEEVIQIGPLVLGKNPKYGKIEDFDYADGGKVVSKLVNAFKKASNAADALAAERRVFKTTDGFTFKEMPNGEITDGDMSWPNAKQFMKDMPHAWVEGDQLGQRKAMIESFGRPDPQNIMSEFSKFMPTNDPNAALQRALNEQRSQGTLKYTKGEDKNALRLVPPPEKADGGKIVKGALSALQKATKMADQDIAAQAIGKAAESAGMKAPVTADKPLTNLQDFHTSLGDRIRERVAEAQRQMDSWEYKYKPGQYVFTEDSARRNMPPMRILEKARSGDKIMREDMNDPLSKKIIDPATGKAMRTPYEPGYRVRMERGPDDWSEFLIPEKAIKGDVDMAKGGAVQHDSLEDLEKFHRLFALHKATGGKASIPHLSLKRVKKFDGGGMAVQSPEETVTPFGGEKSRGAKIAEKLYEMAKEQGKEEVSSLKKPRAITDLLNRGVLANNPVSAGVDLVNMGLGAVGLGSEKPFLGSEHIKDLMDKYGVTSGEERPLMETALSFASPTAVIKGAMGATKGATKVADAMRKPASGLGAMRAKAN